jgi:hypothetical protein
MLSLDLAARFQAGADTGDKSFARHVWSTRFGTNHSTSTAAMISSVCTHLRIPIGAVPRDHIGNRLGWSEKRARPYLR